MNEFYYKSLVEQIQYSLKKHFVGEVNTRNSREVIKQFILNKIEKMEADGHLATLLLPHINVEIDGNEVFVTFSHPDNVGFKE